MGKDNIIIIIIIIIIITIIIIIIIKITIISLLKIAVKVTSYQWYVHEGSPYSCRLQLSWSKGYEDKTPIVRVHWAAECVFLSRGCIATSTIIHDNRPIAFMKQ